MCAPPDEVVETADDRLLQLCVFVMWQWRQSSGAEWKFYSDIENAIIEDVHNRGGERVELDNNVTIDLKKGVQLDAKNKKGNQPSEIRRCNDEEAFPRRDRNRQSDRFSSTPKMISNNKNSNTSFGSGDWNGSRFVFEWQMRCDDLQSLSYGNIMRQSLEGLLFEGKEMDEKHEAQQIVDYLMPVTNESFEKICRSCIRLYTMESFVYRLVNTTLRENDLSKIETLGPFCYLLFQFYFAEEFKDLKFSGRVYRGANLSPSMIDEYEESIGQVRSWLGLTSTTRQRQVAESFPDSTVLFIIDIQDTAYVSARIINNLSMYPHEDEVLIRAGNHFTIDQIQRNQLSKNNIKTLIYLTIE